MRWRPGGPATRPRLSADPRHARRRNQAGERAHAKHGLPPYDRTNIMPPLKTEFEVECPCCRSTLVIDQGLKRVVRHVEPERSDKPKLDDAHAILAEAKARRDALFEQS